MLARIVRHGAPGIHCDEKGYASIEQILKTPEMQKTRNLSWLKQGGTWER